MADKITDLSKEEIAKLYPVELYPYNSKWQDVYHEEEMLILGAIGNKILRIEHFGSTAIGNIVAKDTIDILIAISPEDYSSNEIIEKLKAIQYDLTLQKEGETQHMVLLKGYNTTGEKAQTFHIHMGPANHIIWDRIYFRDYLRKYVEVREQYENLKKNLSITYKSDRVGYRVAKGEFVNRITEEAKNYYQVKSNR